MVVFKNKGKENTAQTVELAVKAAKERGIEYIVVSSNTGETAKAFIGCGLKIICVSSAYGSREAGKNTLSDEMRSMLNEDGVSICTASHILSGVERGISSKAQGMYPAEIMSHTLRMLSQGIKVAVEISIMALDAGLIPYGEKVMVVGGSSSGADTAAVLTPAHAAHVFETKIHEIICKPEL